MPQPVALPYLRTAAAASPVESEIGTAARGAGAHIHANLKSPATKAPPRAGCAEVSQTRRGGNRNTGGPPLALRPPAFLPVRPPPGGPRTAGPLHPEPGGGGPFGRGAGGRCRPPQARRPSAAPAA